MGVSVSKVVYTEMSTIALLFDFYTYHKSILHRLSTVRSAADTGTTIRIGRLQFCVIGISHLNSLQRADKSGQQRLCNDDLKG